MQRTYAFLLSALLLPALAGCEAGVDVEVAALPAPAEAAAGEARRCPHCAWIESKRELLSELAAPLAPRIYEYTLRRSDGSSSVFQEALPATWRVRERVVLIE